MCYLPSIRSSLCSQSCAPQAQIGRVQSGFTLVITLVLMAFLVLLLLALAAFLRIDSQNASRSLEQLQARSYAQLALMVAIGELQESAGPDQRTTATADLAARNLLGDRIDTGNMPANNDPLGDGTRGLTPVREGTRYWTGVWENRNTPADAFTKRPSPALVNWLVSGNGGGNTGDAVFTPATKVDWSSLANFRLTISDNTPGILMVGNGTVGTEDQSDTVLKNFGFQSPTPSDIESYRERFVVAPAVPIRQTRNGEEITVGSYAFWVGDEGVKARVNLPDPLENTSDAAAQRLRARVAQRIAGELATAAEEPQPATSPGSELSGSPGFKYDDYPFPGNRSTDEAVARLPWVISIPNFELLRKPAALENDPQRLQRRFHSITMNSRGVLSDSLSGGLKQDLNFALNNPGVFDDIAASGRILPASVSPATGPNWSTLRDFHELATRTTAAINLDSLAPGPASPASLIAEIRLLFKLFPNRPTGGSPATWHIRTSVLVGIANPYTVALNTSGLHLVFDRLGRDYSTPPSYFDFGANRSWGNWWIWALDKDQYDTINTRNEENNLLPPDERESVGNPALGSRLRSFQVIHRPGTATPPTSPWSLNGSDTAFLIPATSWAPGEMRYFAITDRDQRVANAVGQSIRLSEIPLGPLETHYFTYDTGVPLPAGDDPDSSKYMGWLQFGTHPGWGARYNPTGFAAALYRPVDSPLNTSSPSALTRADIGVLYTAFPTSPSFFPPDLEGGITAGVLEMQTRLPLWSSPYNPNNYARMPYAFRPFADHNFRARYQPPAPLYEGDLVNSYFPFVGRRINASSGFTQSPFLTGWAWGGKYHGVDATSYPTFTPFDLPFRRDSSEPTLLSLGELQHVDLTANDDGESIGFQPGAAVGNSFHVPLMHRDSSVQTREANFYNPPRDMRFFDISYLLNTALFDRFFFSSHVGGAVPDVLPNTRFSITDAEGFLSALPGENPATSPARSLMVEGAFNVNSTSMEAWASVLGSTIRVPVEPDGTSLNVGTPFPRSLKQARGANRAALGNSEDTFAGYRRLTDDEVRKLASEMVRQVRQRGPFLSLSHFVNRTLVAADASGTAPTDPLRPPASMGLSGPLQSAIDAAGINKLPGVGNPFVTRAGNPDGFNNAFWPDYERDYPALQAVSGSTTPPPQGNRFSGVPGFLTQADVLQVLAPVISARSDTFRIRAYGETTNIDGSSGARAWCEAIMERRPEFVDSSNAPGTPGGALSVTNKKFGRKFHIVSFRWLTPDEI